MTKDIRGFVGLVLLLAAVSAHSQITQTIVVKVPFPFVAAGKTLPAADYRVQIVQPVGLVTLSSPGVRSVTMLTNKDQVPGARADQSYLQFRRYGETWVLEWVTYDGTAQLLNMGKVETQLARSKPSAEVALMATNVAAH
jgi:hypothetical protein